MPCDSPLMQASLKKKEKKNAVEIQNGAAMFEAAALLGDNRMCEAVGGWPGIWKDPLILEIISRLNGKCELGLFESSFTWVMGKERWSEELNLCLSVTVSASFSEWI